MDGRYTEERKTYSTSYPKILCFTPTIRLISPVESISTTTATRDQPQTHTATFLILLITMRRCRERKLSSVCGSLSSDLFFHAKTQRRNTQRRQEKSFCLCLLCALACLPLRLGVKHSPYLNLPARSTLSTLGFCVPSHTFLSNKKDFGNHE